MDTTTIDVRVYYEDTDFSGVVYHANYLKYFERGRTEALRATGIGHADMLAADEPLAFTARRLGVEFFKPARIDDLLSVVSSVREARGARTAATATASRTFQKRPSSETVRTRNL